MITSYNYVSGMRASIGYLAREKRAGRLVNTNACALVIMHTNIRIDQGYGHGNAAARRIAKIAAARPVLPVRPGHVFPLQSDIDAEMSTEARSYAPVSINFHE